MEDKVGREKKAGNTMARINVKRLCVQKKTGESKREHIGERCD